jgi:ankyrin repeat protein
MTPLHVAVINKNFEIIISLVNNGANLFLEDKRRNVIIHLIIYF